MRESILFCIVFFIAFTIQGVTGFAGNIFAMPAGTHLLGLSSSVAILNAMNVLACGVLCFMNRKFIDWRELGKIIAGMLPFVILGIWLDSIIELRVLLYIFGAVIIFVGAYNLIAKKQPKLPVAGQFGVIALAGIIQGMFVSGGAFLVIYAAQKLPGKAQFRATLSMVWFILNFIYGVFSFQSGAFTPEVMWVVAACVPLSVISVVLGDRLQRRVSQRQFMKVTYVLLLIIGAVLIITA